MRDVSVIIPAFNEANSIAKVIADIPEIVSEIIVVDNNSTDTTSIAATAAGATVLFEPQKGYGYACLKGINYLTKRSNPPSIVVFMDGDYSDYPEDLHDIVKPITDGEVDFVVGARVKELREEGSMTPQQVFGNWLATALMKVLFKARFSDLGPFRAITYERLIELEMADKTYGWTIEMQLKALKSKIAYTEVPVRYKKRIGISKVSGTLKGTIFAGIKILSWIIKYSVK